VYPERYIKCNVSQGRVKMNIFPKKSDIAENNTRTASQTNRNEVTSRPQSKPIRQLQSPDSPFKQPGTSSDGLEETIISADFTIIGNVISKQKVTVDGTIHGDMHCASLVVAENANIIGSIVANDVTISGTVMGSVFGHKTMLNSTAHVEGDIFHQGLAIELGAVFEGRSQGTDDPMINAPKPESLAETAMRNARAGDTQTSSAAADKLIAGSNPKNI